ncbi:MAG: hypothetical protein LUH03_09815 [Oscillospiraceae bacterium]|nr:hypothetical protein [Oscillospiraceae bacterium]
MTDYNTLIALLQKMAADQLGKYQCYGCGHEHNCGTEGCAILRDAIATIEQLYKDVAGSCEVCVYGDVPYNQEPCKSCTDERIGMNCNWQWQGVRKGAETDGAIPGNAKRV